MDRRHVSESENFITTSVIGFINEHIQSAHLSALDEIILNYVATVLESLALESGDQQESFDVEEFCEMLSAYIPGFETISHNVVTQWICELVANIRKETGRDKPKNDSLAFESFLTEIESNDCMMRSKRFSESSSDSSTTSSGKVSSCRTSRSPKISETSDVGDADADVSYIINRLQACEFQCTESEGISTTESEGISTTESEEISTNDKTQTLLELFPSLQKVEAQHVLATTNGDLEKAVQVILSELECGDGNLPKASKRNPASASNSFRCLLGRDEEEPEEKVLKDRIVARYGFIDQEEDKKEFRPPPLKTEPKKLVRYRESQVVSTKGERYSEVRCANGGDIKNPVYKSPKPY